MRIIRETTEKITETLTEQKTTDNLGLIKKIETRNIVSESPGVAASIATVTAVAAVASTRSKVELISNGHTDRVNGAGDDEDGGDKDYSSLDDNVSATRDAAVKQLSNELFIFDRTKSYNISKRMRKYDDEVAAGFITDYDSKRIINQSRRYINMISLYKKTRVAISNTN